MKSSTLHSSIRILLLGMIAAVAPLNAAMAQGYSDDMRTDTPSSMPSTGEEGTTTINPPEAAQPPNQTESRPSYQDQATQPRGARGPIRGEMSQENLRPTERYVEGLPEYQRQLSNIFRGD